MLQRDMKTCDSLSPCNDVKLLGRAGDAADACLRARAYSDWARGPMYEECVNSFRTHWDDTNPNGPGWQNEYWGKTMLCFAGAVAYTRDPALKGWVLDRAHEFIAEFQQQNGYLSTYSREDFLRNNPEDPDARHHWCFNVWGRKYTLWALIELHKATGDAECLTSAVKMADHLIAQLDRLGLTLDKTGAWHGLSSMSILRPLLELHHLTGTDRYLALAHDIVRAMDAEPATPASLVKNAFREEPIVTWFPLPTFWAKAYEILSCLEGLVEYYRVTGERRALDAVLAWHGHLVREELNPMGSAGYFDHFLNAATHVNGMTELCDVTHWIRLNRELLLLTGDPRYADYIEEAFLNAFLAGVSRDGRWGAHIVRSHGTRHLSAPAQTGMLLHQCCPDNMMRTYFDYAGSQVARAADGALCVLLYTDGAASVGADRVEISGGYPWADGPVSVKVTLAAAGKVRFRVPQWANGTRFVASAETSAGAARTEPGPPPANGTRFVAPAETSDAASRTEPGPPPAKGTRFVAPAETSAGAARTEPGPPSAANDDWIEVDGKAGENAWLLRFDMAPRLVAWTGCEEAIPPSPQSGNGEIPEYTVHFMEWYTPDMAGLSRHEPAMRVLRGPLVLAKGRLAGTSREETLFATTLRGEGWRAAALRPAARTAANVGVVQPWTLVFERDGETRAIPVADFASVSNVDDPANWFSLWF